MKKENKSMSGPADASTSERNYLTRDSSFRGNLSYCYDVPLYKPSYQMIDCGISDEKLCQYSPKVFDLLPPSLMLGHSEIGPLPDLIDPQTTYRPTTGPLCPEDAALVAGLIDMKRTSLGVPSSPPRTPKASCRSTMNNSSSVQPSSDTPCSVGRPKKFVHPVNAALSPLQVFNVLPHPQFDQARLMSVGFRNLHVAQPMRSGLPLFVLEAKNEGTSDQKATHYSLCTPLVTSPPQTPQQRFHPIARCSTYQDLNSLEENGYTMAIEIPHNLHLDFGKPLSEKADSTGDTPPEPHSVYMIPLYRTKVIFSKSTL